MIFQTPYQFAEDLLVEKISVNMVQNTIHNYRVCSSIDIISRMNVNNIMIINLLLYSAKTAN